MSTDFVPRVVLAGVRDGDWVGLWRCPVDIDAATAEDRLAHWDTLYGEPRFTETRLMFEVEYDGLKQMREQFNPYANERPAFELMRVRDPHRGPKYSIMEGGREVASLGESGDLHRDACAARMLSFAGKLHWALGNATAHMKGVAQDLRVIAAQESLAPQLRAALERTAAGVDLASRSEHRAYEGVLLTGIRAKEFDATWQQGQSANPSSSEIEALRAEWARTLPRGNEKPPLDVRSVIHLLAQVSLRLSSPADRTERTITMPVVELCRRVGRTVDGAESFADAIDRHPKAAAVATGLDPDQCAVLAHCVRDGVLQRQAAPTNTARYNGGPNGLYLLTEDQKKIFARYDHQAVVGDYFSGDDNDVACAIGRIADGVRKATGDLRQAFEIDRSAPPGFFLATWEEYQRKFGNQKPDMPGLPKPRASSKQQSNSR